MPWQSRHLRWRAPAGRYGCERWSRAPEPVSRERVPPCPFDEDRQRSVLIVDDDDCGRETLGRILEVGGYRVARAATGSEALWQMREAGRPGLIVLDLLMPGLSGWEFIARQQRDPGLADIPVIVVSAEDASRLGDRRPGVVEQFQKPVPVGE